MTNTSAKRITKKDYYNAIAAFCTANTHADFGENITPEMLVKFAEHEIALLDKKKTNSGTVRKLSPQQAENERIKVEILDFLADGKLHTITDMMNNVPSLITAENMSIHRMSAILSQLCDKGTNEVERQVIKRVTYFKRREF